MAPTLVDEEGKVAINSRETVEALKYLQELYQAFVTGHALLARSLQQPGLFGAGNLPDVNGVSLYFTLKIDPKTAPIAEDTQHTLMPKGAPPASPHTATVMNAMVFRHTRYPNAAKAFLTFMLESEQYDPWMQGCIGYWASPLKAYAASSAVWTSDPKLTVFREAMNSPFWSGYRGPISQASGAVAADYVLVQMCAAWPPARRRRKLRRGRPSGGRGATTARPDMGGSLGFDQKMKVTCERNCQVEPNSGRNAL